MKEYAYIHQEGTLPQEIENSPFLASFADNHRDELLHISSLVEADPGDEIISEGADTSRIFILLSGEIEIRKNGKSITTMGKVGEIFGEIAAVDGEARSASVVAVTTAVCLAVDQRFLRDIKPLEEDPSFYAALYEAIAKILATRLKSASEEIARLEAVVKNSAA